MHCVHCGFLQRPTDKFCGACGKPNASAAPRGPSCAHHVERAATHTCTRCGTFVCAGCVVTGPGGQSLCSSCAGKVQDTALPWDQRGELGVWRAYWRTSIAVLGRPTATFSAVRPEGSVASSVGFAALGSAVGASTTTLLMGIGVTASVAFSSRGQAEPTMSLPAVLGLGVAVTLGYLAVFIVSGLLSLFVMSGLEHLTLLLLGARPAYAVTMRAHALSYGPYLLGLVPLCGLYVFPIWSLVTRGFAYRHLHRASWGQAVGGVLLPVGAVILLFVLSYAALMALVLSRAK